MAEIVPHTPVDQTLVWLDQHRNKPPIEYPPDQSGERAVARLLGLQRH
jgi:hypothetical protein